MRVMVSLNLADIMTATCARTTQHLSEALDGETDPTCASQEELQLLKQLDHTEPFDREPGTKPTKV